MRDAEVSIGRSSVTCRVTSGASGVTVVLLHGTGLTRASWEAVQQELDGVVTSVSYDRPALLSALSVRGPAPAEDLAVHLERLLEAGGFDGPYLLVGHSWGAVVARAFAQDREDVLSMVLVDGTHEELTSLRDPLFRALRAGACVLSHLVPVPAAQELAGLRRSLQALRPPAVPVWAITGGRGTTRRERRVRADFAAAYTAGAARHVVAPQSGHLVPLEAPEVVVACVLDALRVQPQGAA